MAVLMAVPAHGRCIAAGVSLVRRAHRIRHYDARCHRGI